MLQGVREMLAASGKKFHLPVQGCTNSHGKGFSTFL